MSVSLHLTANQFCLVWQTDHKNGTYNRVILFVCLFVCMYAKCISPDEVRHSKPALYQSEILSYIVGFFSVLRWIRLPQWCKQVSVGMIIIYMARKLTVCLLVLIRHNNWWHNNWRRHLLSNYVVVKIIPSISSGQLNCWLLTTTTTVPKYLSLYNAAKERV